MGEINYETLIKGLIQPLVTHPENVEVIVEQVDGQKYVSKVIVDSSDLGRVIGKKGRVASALRTLVHAAAMRNSEIVDVSFTNPDELALDKPALDKEDRKEEE